VYDIREIIFYFILLESSSLQSIDCLSHNYTLTRRICTIIC